MATRRTTVEQSLQALRDHLAACEPCQGAIRIDEGRFVSCRTAAACGIGAALAEADFQARLEDARRAGRERRRPLEIAAAERRRLPFVAAGVDLKRALAALRALPCLRGLVPRASLKVRHSAGSGSSGHAKTWRGSIVLTIGSTADRENVLEMLVHEVCHLALPKAYHGPRFRHLLRQAAREAWGIEVAAGVEARRGKTAYGLDDLIRQALAAKIDAGEVETYQAAPLAPAPVRAEKLAALVVRREGHARRMLARAERRAKIAKTVLSRWRSKVAYYERVAAKRRTS